MSWLSRLNPRATGSRSGRSAAPSSPCTADPETCLMVFENHWRQVSWVLEQHEPSSSSDDLTAVRNHTDQMLCLLAEERPAESSDGGTTVLPMGPILELVVTENILEHLVQWHLRRGLDPDSQGALLKLYEMLIGQSQQPLLQHTAVLHPLLRLLGACADPELGCPSGLENSLVLLLNQICVSMARQPVVLEMLFRAAPAQQGSTNLLIFSLLVPFIHRDGAIGQQARDALLLVMATSASNESVARYIAENSYFCPVLATGLSALYSSLPRKIEVRGDDWHALRREDWMGVSSLVLFMNSLEFCNAVVQVAHPLVQSQLLDYLHNGFLVPVMGPALHKSSVDEMIASTAYLDLFLRSVSETSLLKTFLRFILLHRHDNDTILDTLLTRISSNSRLCMVSLSLFRTLLSLNCEDIMLQLVLRYLLPCTHVMLSQRRAIRETDMYGKSADKFLSLIPECCRFNAASSAEREEDNPFWGKVLSSPSTESPTPSRPSTPSRLVFFIRQPSIGGGLGGGGPSTPTSMEAMQSGPPGSHPLSPESPMHPQLPHTESLDWDSGYLEYLKDARRGIEFCSWACRDWSAPYDGENPSPNTVPPPPPPPTSNPSMAMFPEHFSFQQGGSSGTPPGQQRAAIVAAARSEWSSSERDSGEWDVTIGKNNCISLTPRSKKRSLQREELLPKPVPRLIPSSSSSAAPLSTSYTASPPAPHIPTSAITVSYQAMYNGTMSGDGCSDNQDRGLEVKKVKRDLGEQQYLDENANQNGSLVTCPSQSCSALTQSIFNNSDISDAKSLCANQLASQSSVTQQPSDTKLPTSDTSYPHSASSDLPEVNQLQQSVESLIQELLEQAPGEPQPPGDSNGQGISIEAFTRELSELEDRVKERSRAACQQEETAREMLSAERQEEEQQLEVKLTGDTKGEGAMVGLCSPARPLNQPSSQPYTGPFMVVLFTKLENMLQNSLYVNILLTGIVAQLACYPQPLLRSFLLNTNMVFQPSVKSLIQVLGSVKNRIEAFAASHEDFPAMLKKAQQYLVARGKVDWADSPAGVPTLRRSDSLVKSRKPSLGDLILRHTNSPTRARHAAQLALAHVRDGGQSLHSALFRGSGGSGASGLEKQAEALRVKNAVYCAVIFCEFLKELAALAQEHAVNLPFPQSQEE
ncbi:FTS and Hook-interacting protein homolog isoform X1 [Notolabrus celidotus]|uniref:FTS and Hook-interacting protein homolog isoform X1 n=1 Tax=Notolabrus celidotus TaxID=1203425 RepID=UPI00148FC570|nr:FTS and Hook-interacting protein homolog isoform X1 [Notolabrus celidotus]XP_034549742.1 FTS and Hook-interacting protein homolog isoform X1 [Notolabrus celidotus]